MRRYLSRIDRFCFSLVAVGGCMSAVAAAPAQNTLMPFDLPYSGRTLAFPQRIVVSPDGKTVAFTLHEPMSTADAAAKPAGKGILEGVAFSYVMTVSATGGPQQRIAPDGGNCWAPIFSPDSSALALYCDGAGEPQLWVHDFKRGGARRVAAAPIKPKPWRGGEPHWSPDGKTIYVPLAVADAVVSANPATVKEDRGAAVTVDLSGAELPPQSVQDADGNAAESINATKAALGNHLGAIDAASGVVKILASIDDKPTPNALQLSPSGKWVSYLSVFYRATARQDRMFQDLMLVPAAGGATRAVVTEIPSAADYLLGTYIWHPSRDQLFWIKDRKLWTLDVESPAGTPQPLAQQVGEVIPGFFAVTRDGESIVLGVQPMDKPTYGDAHPKALAVIPLNGAAPKVIPLPAGLLFVSAVEQRRGVLWQPRPQRFTVLCRESKNGQTVALQFDIAAGRTSRLWQGGGRIEPGFASDDHAVLAGSYSDLNTPDDVYTFSSDFSHKARISRVEPRFEGVRVGTAETFEVPLHRLDGAGSSATVGVLLPPGAKRGDKLPALVFVYPRHSYVKSITEFGGGMPGTLPAAVFTTRGYAVVFTDAAVRPLNETGDFISDLVDVITPQVQHAAALGYIDGNRVAVSGQSFGGYSTAALLSATNLFRAGVAVAGSYDMTYFYASMGKKNRGFAYPPGIIENYWSLGDHPWNQQRRFIDASPFFRADRIRSPLLLIHGDQDDICPVEDVRLMFNALRRLGKTAQLAEYAGEGHVPTLWRVENAADAARRAVEFLDKYVKPTAH